MKNMLNLEESQSTFRLLDHPKMQMEGFFAGIDEQELRHSNDRKVDRETRRNRLNETPAIKQAPHNNNFKESEPSEPFALPVQSKPVMKLVYVCLSSPVGSDNVHR